MFFLLPELWFRMFNSLNQLVFFWFSLVFLHVLLPLFWLLYQGTHLHFEVYIYISILNLDSQWAPKWKLYFDKICLDPQDFIFTWWCDRFLFSEVSLDWSLALFSWVISWFDFHAGNDFDWLLLWCSISWRIDGIIGMIGFLIRGVDMHPDVYLRGFGCDGGFIQGTDESRTLLVQWWCMFPFLIILNT